jgi:hypothetical protein
MGTLHDPGRALLAALLLSQLGGRAIGETSRVLASASVGADCKGKDVKLTSSQRDEVKRDADVVEDTLWGERITRAPSETAVLLFFGHPRSGHSLVGSIIDSHPRAVVANEYNLLKQLASPLAGGGQALPSRRKHIAGMLGNSRGCGVRRVQAGYNYSVSGGWQGRWELPLRALGDKKGGDTSRQFAANFNRSLHSLMGFRSTSGTAVPFVYKIVRVIRNPFDQIASSFSRGYFHTHPELFANPSRFDTAAFVRVAPHISFRASDYAGATAELQRYGSASRNMVGRALDFFALHSANEKFLGLLNANDSRLPKTEWLDVYLDDLQTAPTHEIHRICSFLGLPPTSEFVARAVAAVSTVHSAPSRMIRWPSNFANAIRQCIRRDVRLRRFEDTEIRTTDPILADLDGWSSNGCIFEPTLAATVFRAHCRSVPQPLGSDCH